LILNKIFRLSQPFSRSYASVSSIKPEITLTNDESTFVVWHKKPTFPYECTRELPQRTLQQQDTVLKTQFTSEMLSEIKTKKRELAIQDLISITFTSKHRWARKNRLNKYKKYPNDREFL